MPDIVLTEPERMKTVEGAGNLPMWRYQAMCDVCHDHTGGACVTCNETSCKRAFHVSCAWQAANFVLGFDIQPVKSSRRDTVPTTSFRGENGHMSAVVYCNLHRDVGKNKGLHDWADIDPATGMTAAQVFAVTHKSVANDRSVSTGLVAASSSLGSGAAGNASSQAQSSGGPGGAGAFLANAQTSSSSSILPSSEGTYGLLRRAKRLDLALSQLQPNQQGGVLRSSSSNKRLSSAYFHASLSATPAPSAPGHSYSHPMTLMSNLTNSNANTSSSINLMGNSSSAIAGANGSAGVGGPPPKSCVRCQSQFSPFWFDVPMDAREINGVREGNGHDDNNQQLHNVEESQNLDWLKAVKDASTMTSGGLSNAGAGTPVLCLRCRHAVLPTLQ